MRKKNRLRCQKFHVENFADITALIIDAVFMLPTSMQKYMEDVLLIWSSLYFSRQ